MATGIFKNKGQEKGFTILESLVVVLIIAVIAGFAIPSYNRMLANTKLQNKTTEWREAFYYAQREAIRLKHNVVLCPSEDGESCNNTADYNVGWIVYDKTVNRLMRDYPPSTGSDKFEISLSGGVNNGGNSITFLNNGRPKDNNAGRAFKVIYTYGRGATPAKMESNFRVSPSGRIIAGELTNTSEDA